MSKVLSSQSYMFHTDIGNMHTTVEEVEGYDVEDIVADMSFSQVQVLVFDNVAANTDINAYQGPRTIKSVYSTTGES